jgi:hypothetical protein
MELQNAISGTVKAWDSNEETVTAESTASSIIKPLKTDIS